MTEIKTLRPGLLVSLNTSLRGNVSYQKVQLEAAHITETGEQRAKWETERTITDPIEHEAAVKLRAKARWIIAAKLSKSEFGYLCPESDADALVAAIAEARTLADEFNSTALHTRVGVNVLYGRIAQDDVEAVKAISSELRDLMADMQEGIATLNVKAVRDACTKAKAVGNMLSDSARERLNVAIEAARKSARAIVKAGEVVGQEIDRAAIERIDQARTSFLDLEEDTQEIASPEFNAPGVDFDPSVSVESQSVVTPTLEFDDEVSVTAPVAATRSYDWEM